MKYYIIIFLLSVLITEIIIRLITIQKNWLKQLLPFLVCLVFFFIPWLIGIGIFKDQNILWLFAVSISGGLSANGLFTWKVTQTVLNWLFKFLPKKE
jgi:hypothetical protein